MNIEASYICKIAIYSIGIHISTRI